jgi:hypothetical protein
VDQERAEQGAEQDGEERRHLDQPIAADQLVAAQHLGQDAVLERTEHGRVEPHHEQHRQQQVDAVHEEAVARDQHDRDLHRLDDLGEPGLVVLVRELAGGGGKKKERQDEQAGRQVRVAVLVLLAEPDRGPHDQDHQRVLEHVVVERAQGLGQEERQEAALPEQRELALVRHGGPPWVRQRSKRGARRTPGTMRDSRELASTFRVDRRPHGIPP